MSIWDAITGKSSKRAAENAGRAYADGVASATKTQKQGTQRAQDWINNSTATQIKNIEDTQRYLHDNVWTPTAGNISGNINAGFGDAATEIRNTRDRIQGYFNPMLQLGTQANDLYGRFIGLQGADAAKMAASEFAGNDPGIGYRLDMIRRQAERAANASGNIGGVRAEMALNRSQNELLSNDYQNYLTRLENAASRGGQYAGQLAGYDASLGNQLAGLSVGRGQALAQNDARHAEALSNLYGGSPIATGQLARWQGATNADIERGNTQALTGFTMTGANNAAQTEMAKGAADQAGLNNMLKIAGLAVSAATGMPTGLGGGATTTPGTKANGGWSTTTTPQNNSWFGSWFS